MPIALLPNDCRPATAAFLRDLARAHTDEGFVTVAQLVIEAGNLEDAARAAAFTDKGLPPN